MLLVCTIQHLSRILHIRLALAIEVEEETLLLHFPLLALGTLMQLHNAYIIYLSIPHPNCNRHPGHPHAPSNTIVWTKISQSNIQKKKKKKLGGPTGFLPFLFTSPQGRRNFPSFKCFLKLFSHIEHHISWNSYSAHDLSFSNLAREYFTYLITFWAFTIGLLRSFKPSCTRRFKLCAQHLICRKSHLNMLLSLSFNFLLE